MPTEHWTIPHYVHPYDVSGWWSEYLPTRHPFWERNKSQIPEFSLWNPSKRYPLIDGWEKIFHSCWEWGVKIGSSRRGLYEGWHLVLPPHNPPLLIAEFNQLPHIPFLTLFAYSCHNVLTRAMITLRLPSENLPNFRIVCEPNKRNTSFWFVYTFCRSTTS